MTTLKEMIEKELSSQIGYESLGLLSNRNYKRTLQAMLELVDAIEAAQIQIEGEVVNGSWAEPSSDEILAAGLESATKKMKGD